MKLRILVPSRPHVAPLRYFFFLLAVGCLGTYAYSYIERTLYQSRESRNFDRSLGHAAAVALASAGPAAPVQPNPRSSRISAASLQLPSPAALIGRISIPRLGLTTMVREGIDANTLRLAVGHIPSTPLPGHPGNVAVAGHRDTFFRSLKDLAAKDEIQFSTSNGEFTYEVESLTIVEPDNVAVVAASSGNVLTLVTCYPFSYVGSAPKRFVVRARQVSPRTATSSTVE